MIEKIGLEYFLIILLGIAIIALTTISIYLRFEMIRRKKKKPPVDIGNAQYIGTREKQDDSFATVEMPYGTMAIVADGIGGFLNGNVASKMTVDSYVRNFKKGDVTGNVNYFFNHAAKEANYEIRKKFEDSPCGTTAVAVVLIRNMLYWYSVGDSNIALFRNGRIITVNRKQNFENWLEEQYFDGKLRREDVVDHPQSRRLMNYIGYDGFQGGEEAKAPIELKKGDKVLLYSDGIEALSQIELENILMTKQDAETQAEQIINAIKYKDLRNKDNATIIMLDIRRSLE